MPQRPESHDSLLPEEPNDAYYQVVSWYCGRTEFDECDHTLFVGADVITVPSGESGMSEYSAAVEKARKNAPQCPIHGDTMVPFLVRMDKAPPTVSSSPN